MIGQLRGRLAGKRPNQVLIDVGGVGYLVQVPLSTYAALGELHTEVTLLIYTHVREDALTLFGFVSSREKNFFELLISASGVGPALALRILSGMSVEELVPAIRGGEASGGFSRRHRSGRGLGAREFGLRHTRRGGRRRRRQARSRREQFRDAVAGGAANPERAERPRRADGVATVSC